MAKTPGETNLQKHRLAHTPPGYATNQITSATLSLALPGTGELYFEWSCFQVNHSFTMTLNAAQTITTPFRATTRSGIKSSPQQ